MATSNGTRVRTTRGKMKTLLSTARKNLEAASSRAFRVSFTMRENGQDELSAQAGMIAEMCDQVREIITQYMESF